MRRLSPVLLLVAVAGCQTAQFNPIDDLAGTDMSQPPDLLPPDLELPFRDPTDHPPLLTMPDNGGPVMKNIEVWTVVWAGDEALGAQMNEFLRWMVQSDDYYIASLGQYGVGKGSAMGVLVIPDAKPATLDDQAVGPIIKAHIADHSWPTPNSNTLFSFLFPSNTKSTMFGGQGCTEYGGYHSETRTANGAKTYVAYSVNLQCGGFGGNNNFDSLSEVVSHETSEVATDPHPFTAPGFVTGDAPFGGEVSDLCNGLSSSFTEPLLTGPDGGENGTYTYFVTRNWSNAAATAGNADPCQPVLPGTPYFNVAVNPPDVMITIPSTGMTTTEVLLEPYAFGDVGTIKWQLQTAPGAGIKISPQAGQSTAGATIRLEITVSSVAKQGLFPIDFYTQSSKAGHNQWVSTITLQ